MESAVGEEGQGLQAHEGLKSKRVEIMTTAA